MVKLPIKTPAQKKLDEALERLKGKSSDKTKAKTKPKPDSKRKADPAKSHPRKG